MDSKQIIERLRHLAEGEDYHGRVQVRRAHTGVPKFVSAEIADHAGDHYFSMAKLFRAAADLLEADGWVSVDERLPDKMSSVIFWCESSRQIGWAFYNSIGEWCGSDGRLAGVSHWRPIPTPPGGDHD